MFSNNQFYPTPDSLINKMVAGIEWDKVSTILEPSAGKGDIADKVKNKIELSRWNRDGGAKRIDTIEINSDLQAILKDKGYRVVHNDFLTYNTLKRYDLIIMNPPFKDGDRHLLKAIEMQKRGGKVICILNAETLLNPYSNTRKELVQKLAKYNADIEYISEAFTSAERKTNVEIALVKLDIPRVKHSSKIIEDLKQEESYNFEDSFNTELAQANFLDNIVERYNFEVRAGLNLIREYMGMKSLIKHSFEDKYSDPILSLELRYKDRDNPSTLENGFIEQVRMKYWKALFTSKEFMGLFTSNLRQEYYNKVSELKDYDFSLYNIYTIRAELSKELVQGVEDTIIDLFEELSNKYHYYDKNSTNIHYYNGWKTNKAYKINDKVIIRLNGFCDIRRRFNYSWNVREKLADIEKVFNYLDGGITEDIDLLDVLTIAETEQQSRNIETKYFTVSFYKKGTAHIKFKDQELLKKFNLYAARHRNWLPPTYGNVEYDNMTAKEQAVVDEFEGEKSYQDTLDNKDYYLVEAEGLLALTS